MGEVGADVAVGFGGGQGGGGDVVAQGDALVEGCHVTDPKAAAEGGLADEEDGDRGCVVHAVVGEHSDGVELGGVEEVGFVNG